MTFQYFFFDTYVGYFLQALPIALAVSRVYGVLRFHSDRETPLSVRLWSCAFVCCLTGLICLVIAFELLGIFYYGLFYHMDSMREIRWFEGGVNLIPNFFRHINGEVVGNALMLLPYGILYPLSHPTAGWKRTLGTGFLTILTIEVVQPIFGRACDVNDLLLNGMGIFLSASAFFFLRWLVKKLPHRGA